MWTNQRHKNVWSNDLQEYPQVAAFTVRWNESRPRFNWKYGIDEAIRTRDLTGKFCLDRGWWSLENGNMAKVLKSYLCLIAKEKVSKVKVVFCSIATWIRHIFEDIIVRHCRRDKIKIKNLRLWNKWGLLTWWLVPFYKLGQNSKWK